MSWRWANAGVGHDLPSLLYNLMDEFLFRFSADYLIFKDVKVLKLDLSQRPFRIVAEGYGPLPAAFRCFCSLVGADPSSDVLHCSGLASSST